MSRTGLGIVVTAGAWTLLGAAFVLGSWGAAMGALGVLVVVGSTRPGRARDVTAQRSVGGNTVQGDVLTVTVDAAAPTPGLLDIDAPLPPGLTLLRTRRTHDRGQATLTQTVQARVVGDLPWPPVTVRVTDAWGLRATAYEQNAPCPTLVAPNPRWALHGRRLGLRRTVQETVRARIASERSLETERVREHLPGDNLRDIDWKTTSRMHGLQVRERERHTPRPVSVVLDCGPAMRVQRHDCKLVSAAHLAHGVLAAAAGAGTAAVLVAAHADGVERRPVRGLGDAESALLEVLSAAPALPAASVRRHAIEPAAVDRVGDTPGVQVLILDAETDPDGAIQALTRAVLRGRAHLVIPLTGAHLYRRHEARGGVLAALMRWRRNRRRVEEAACRLRVPVHLLHPAHGDRVLERVTEALS